MPEIQIIGIMLIKNEDLYLERVVRNVIEFCDKLIIADNQSTDHTFDICTRLASEFAKIELRKINNTAESAQMLVPYYNTNTWVFAVDGDEIYDPKGLGVMRDEIFSGTFADTWCVFGNVLNVTKLDSKENTAWGYLSPPSRPVTKLYNFSLIEDWQDCVTERLHGGKIIFKPGFGIGLRRYLYEEYSWETAYFRCIHVAFLPRSSKDFTHLYNTRLNPDELHRMKVGNFFLRFFNFVRIRVYQILNQNWKNRKYKLGRLVKKDVRDFFLLKK